MAEILDIKDFTQVTNLSDDDRLLLTIAANNHFAGATTISTLRQFVEDIIDDHVIVTPIAFDITNFSGGGTYEKGSSQTMVLNWAYNKDVDSQTINGVAISKELRTTTYTNVVTNTTYTLNAIAGEETKTRSVSATFNVKKYYGVFSESTITSEDILGLTSAWASKTLSITQFDCTCGKYVYYIIPTSIATNLTFWVGGLQNSDWITTTMDLTNLFGHTESYTIYRLNNKQTGILNIEVR